MEGGAPHFDVSIIGVRKIVRSGHGLSVPVRPVTPDLKPDWVIVPALATGTPEVLVPALARPDVRKAQAQLLKWHAEGAQIAASCIGTFLLAETGLLDDREATTTWWLAPLFRQRYPKVLLDESRMLVPSDRGVTGGAAMGHLDLTLWLIRKASPELATLVSRYLLADIRSLQAPYIIPNHLAQADPLIARFERWARENLKEGFSLQEAAGAIATSARTLQRRCEAVLGKSPLSGCARPPPRRACAIPALRGPSRPRRHRGGSGLCRWSDAGRAVARAPGTGRPRAPRRPTVTSGALDLVKRRPVIHCRVCHFRASGNPATVSADTPVA